MSKAGQFKLWSQTSKEIHVDVSPEIPWRNFDEIGPAERRDILMHFNKQGYFWGYKTISTRSYSGHTRKSISERERCIAYAINSLNELYKKECYARNTLEKYTIQNAYEDFTMIFTNKKQNVVYELISLYCDGLIETSSSPRPIRMERETEDDYEKRLVNAKHVEFDEFKDVFNDIFASYRINVHLTRNGLVPAQDPEIINTVYEPVISALSHPKWHKVNHELKDALAAYAKNKPDSYSESMTHAYSAVQAFLQELTNSKKGIKDASLDAASQGLIPADPFSKETFTQIMKTFARLRMKHGDAHPKEEYANEQTAKLMLNLSFIYIQHCIAA